MDEKIIKIKNKIVKLEDFFRDMAGAFSDKAGLKNICFLTLDDKTLGFVTAFSTIGSNIRLSKKDLTAFKQALVREIFFPRKVLWNWVLLKRLRHFQIIWKVYVCGISAIMPIQGSNGVCCLIVFCDRRADGWFSKNIEYTNTINKHIAFCLEAIWLYNQALEGIIRKYDPSYERLPFSQVQPGDEQIPVLIEKKMEFL